MKLSEQDKWVIEQYEQDEEMMVLIFAQWCINNDLDPKKLYKQAYPNQLNHGILDEVIPLTVSKKESDTIADETLLNALQLFGNADLAFVVQREIEKRKK